MSPEFEKKVNAPAFIRMADVPLPFSGSERRKHKHELFRHLIWLSFSFLLWTAFPAVGWGEESRIPPAAQPQEESAVQQETFPKTNTEPQPPISGNGTIVPPTEQELIQLQNGIAMLREGDFESALEIFRSAENAPFLNTSVWNAASPAGQPVLAELSQTALNAFHPASEYWFYRAAAEHQVLEKEACLKSLTEFRKLENISEKNASIPSVPARFSALAQLMEKDLERLQDKSLEMVSRKMKSVERNLDSGNAGEKVQNSEEEIVKMLDSMIEEMEQESQNQKKQMSRSLKPGKPSEKAKPSGGKGPGHVTRRELKFEKEWGTLPEKEREEILQQLGRDFPPHYREAIEQYFRRIAE